MEEQGVHHAAMAAVVDGLVHNAFVALEAQSDSHDQVASRTASPSWHVAAGTYHGCLVVVRTSLASTLGVGTAGGSGAVAAAETVVARKVAEGSDYGTLFQSHADGVLAPLNSEFERVGAALSLLETAFYFVSLEPRLRRQKSPARRLQLLRHIGLTHRSRDGLTCSDQLLSPFPRQRILPLPHFHEAALIFHPRRLACALHTTVVQWAQKCRRQHPT